MLPLRDNAPTRSRPLVTYALIAANFAVWFWELQARAGRIDHYAYYPCSVEGPCLDGARDHLPFWEGAVSSMFMHASWIHILGNMLFLGLWFGLQVWQGGASLTHPEASGGVALFAHIGGFVFGALTVHAFAIRRPLRPSW